jgi:DNA-binding Lrp family transcriptional regulator
MSNEERTVDELDRQLVQRLRADGRESNRSLARALGINEATVASRLRRLEAADVMRVVAVSDMEAFGLHCLSFVFINVRSGAPAGVARDLAQLPSTIAVAAVTGRFDIVATILTAGVRELADVVGRGVMPVPGVEEVRVEQAVSVLRFDSAWAGLRPHQRADSRPTPSSGDQFSPLDLRLIAALQRDARASNRRIAHELGVAEATIRSRLRNLEAAGCIRIQAVCDVESFGLNAYGFVGIRAQAGQLDAAAGAMLAEPTVGLLARTIGSYDYVAVVAADSREALLHTVLQRIRSDAAVRHAELLESYSILKHLHTWTKLDLEHPIQSRPDPRTLSGRSAAPR